MYQDPRKTSPFLSFLVRRTVPSYILLACSWLRANSSAYFHSVLSTHIRWLPPFHGGWRAPKVSRAIIFWLDRVLCRANLSVCSPVRSSRAQLWSCLPVSRRPLALSFCCGFLHYRSFHSHFVIRFVWYLETKRVQLSVSFAVDRTPPLSDLPLREDGCQTIMAP